jgi:SAM-dependent methyltransferase
MSAEFDRFRDSYEVELGRALGPFGDDVDGFAETKARRLLALAQERFGETSGRNVLDVGCGVGLTDGFLEPHVGSIVGTDVSEEMVRRAAAENPAVTYTAYDGHTLPFEDDSFDLVFAICVVHHVLPGRWDAFVGELARVTRSAGLVAIGEHNPLNPLTRLVVSRCSFDGDAVLLGRRVARGLLTAAGLKPSKSPYIVFFPWRNSTLERIERRLERLPLGAQYFAVGEKR